MGCVLVWARPDGSLASSEHSSWVVASTSASVGRDSAMQRKFASLQLVPQCAVALPAPPHQQADAAGGALFAPLPLLPRPGRAGEGPRTAGTEGDCVGLAELPFLLCGHFALARFGGRHLFSLSEMEVTLPRAALRHIIQSIDRSRRERL